jgi:tetratricopeptide (TPR) repeat protein
MQYKGTTKSLREIGHELGVGWALTGSVRKAGNALRISAQLVNVHADESAWSETFSGTMDDVFDVQERVARSIVEALDVALSPVESARLRERPIRDPRAFELYLKAREILAGFDAERARPLIARAVEIEGDVPALRALRAMSSIALLRTAASRDSALMDDIESEARTLIEISSDQAWGYTILGMLSHERGDQATAVGSLRRALELDPADADVRFSLSISLTAAGHADPRIGLDWVARDPLAPLAHALVATTGWFTGRAREVLPAMEESVRLAPMAPILHWALGYHYALVGRFDDAAREADWLLQNAADLLYTAQFRALLAAVAGRSREALDIVASVDEAALDGHHTMHLAESYAMAGEHERAVALLDRAVTLGYYPYDFYARWCPFYEPLRNRDDFARVLDRAAARVAEFQAERL